MERGLARAGRGADPRAPRARARRCREAGDDSWRRAAPGGAPGASGVRCRGWSIPVVRTSTGGRLSSLDRGDYLLLAGPEVWLTPNVVEAAWLLGVRARRRRGRGTASGRAPRGAWIRRGGGEGRPSRGTDGGGRPRPEGAVACLSLGTTATRPRASRDGLPVRVGAGDRARTGNRGGTRGRDGTIARPPNIPETPRARRLARDVPGEIKELP